MGAGKKSRRTRDGFWDNEPVIKNGVSDRNSNLAALDNEPSRLWRKREDSNLRYGYPHTRFPSVLLKPLGHTSA